MIRRDRWMRAIGALLSVGLPVGWLYLLHVAHVLGHIPSRAAVGLLFLPIVLVEVAASLWDSGRLGRGLGVAARPRGRRGWSAGEKGLFILRLLGWVGLLQLLVLWPGELIEHRTWRWIKFVGPRFYVNTWLVLWGMGVWTALVAGVGAGVWWALVVRRGVGRMSLTLGIPAVGAVGLFGWFYHDGGRGAADVAEIVATPGVTRVFGVEDLDVDLTRRPHPRDICVSPDAAVMWVSFGCTLCKVEEPYPTLVRLARDPTDPAAGWTATHHLVTGPIRRFSCPSAADPALTVAPWLDEVILRLDPDDLAVIARFPAIRDQSVDLWEPMEVVVDPKLRRIFVGNDVEQAVLAYDLDDGAFLGARNLWADGLVEYGVAVHNLSQPTPGGSVWFTSGYGENLFELDPVSLELLRHIPLDDATGTGLALDPTHVWYQPALRDEILMLNRADLSVAARFSGERFSRRILVDAARGRLYVLGYFSGTVFALDLATGVERWRVRVGGRPDAMVMADDALWTNSMAGVVRVALEGR